MDFHDGCHGGDLEFWSRMILAIFAQQDNLLVPTEFQVNWPLGSGEAKNRL